MSLIVELPPCREAESSRYSTERQAIQKLMNGDFTILLAEDDERDVWLVTEALNRAGITNHVQVVRDGAHAIDYLRGHGEYSDRSRYPLPNLVLLDIKMPKKDGLEVLEWIRSHSEDGLKKLPAIIMSSSAIQKDIDRAYELGVNAYLIKPHAFDELVQTLKTTTEFWKDTAVLPQV